MSYRQRWLRKMRRPKTGRQLRWLIVRDTRFCERWNIPEDQAWRWNRHPDRTVTLE